MVYQAPDALPHYPMMMIRISFLFLIIKIHVDLVESILPIPRKRFLEPPVVFSKAAAPVVSPG